MITFYSGPDNRCKACLARLRKTLATSASTSLPWPCGDLIVPDTSLGIFQGNVDLVTVKRFLAVAATTTRVLAPAGATVAVVLAGRGLYKGVMDYTVGRRHPVLLVPTDPVIKIDYSSDDYRNREA